MKKVITHLSAIFGIVLLIGVQNSYAQEQFDGNFNIINSLSIDEARAIVAAPSMTFTTNEVITKDAYLEVVLPQQLTVIFSSDISSLQIGGAAAEKVLKPTLDDLSYDQKTLKVSLQESFQVGDNLTLSGLYFKVYNEESSYLPITLKITDSGVTETLITRNEVRVDDAFSGGQVVRRRGTDPEPIRKFEVMRMDQETLRFGWNHSPDLDSTGYIISIEDAAGNALLTEERLTSNFIIVESANSSDEFKMTITVDNFSGYSATSSKVVQLTMNEEQTDGETDEEGEDPQNIIMNPLYSENYEVVYGTTPGEEGIVYKELSRDEFKQILQVPHLQNFIDSRYLQRIVSIQDIQSENNELFTKNDVIRVAAFLVRLKDIEDINTVVRSDLEVFRDTYNTRVGLKERIILYRKNILSSLDEFNPSEDEPSNELTVILLGRLITAFSE